MIRTIAIACALAGLAWLVLTIAPTVGPAGPAGTSQTPNVVATGRGTALARRAADRAPGNEASNGAPGGATPTADTAIQANRADRNVTPDGMTFGPGHVERLQRIAPREEGWAPSSPLVEAEASARNGKAGAGKPEASTQVDQPFRPTLLPRPVALDTAHLKIGEGTIVLPGIAPLPLDAQCGSGGGAWPCGMRARTAFRAYLRSRSIRCEVPGDFVEREQTVASNCTVGGGDVGDWLVENGWAGALGDGPYAELEVKAKKAGRGIWGKAPGIGGPAVGRREGIAPLEIAPPDVDLPVAPASPAVAVPVDR